MTLLSTHAVLCLHIMGLLFQTIQGIYWIFHVIYRWNYTEFNWIIQFSGIWNWLTMSNVNNNNHISIYYYAKSIYSISGISFARLLKTSKSSLYIYFIPLWLKPPKSEKKIIFFLLFFRLKFWKLLRGFKHKGIK